MPLDATRLTAEAAARALSVAADKLNGLSLRGKVNWLRQHRAADQIQQMQSDTIAELYDAVRQIQEAIWPILILLPDVSGARDAAAAAGTSNEPVGGRTVSRLPAPPVSRRA